MMMKKIGGDEKRIGSSDTQLERDTFRKYATYYDLLYKNKNYRDEAEFISNLIRHLISAPPSEIGILDLACGTGKHAMELARLGYQVEGSDISGEMIAIAKSESKKCDYSIPFYNESFQTCANIGKKYHIILAMFSAINYLTTYDDFSLAMRNIASLLHDDGYFIFDCWNGTAVIRDFSPVRIKRVSGSNKEVIRISETAVDQISQLATVNFDFLLLQNGSVAGEFKEKHIIRYYFLQELADLLKANYFEIIDRRPFMQPQRDVEATDWNVTHIVRALQSG